MDHEKKIEIIYSEYKRLCERLDNLIDGSLSDFKLLSFVLPVITGVGGLVASDKLPAFKIEAPQVVGFGFFLTILLVVTIIAFRDMLKLSMINYHVVLIKKYEAAISDMLETKKAFNNIQLWNSKFVKNHYKIYGLFTLITIVCLTIIPVLILISVQNGSNYALAYGAICICIYALHFYALNNFLRKPFKELTIQNNE
nr:hypothetical protein [uncultured Allomuricauda sp.]